MGKVNNALRMLAILRSREKVSRRELAEELEVTVREISRYKEDLEYAGVHIQDIRGKYGGYRLENNDYLLNLDLSINEEYALQNAIDNLNGQGLHFYNDLKSAVGKIRAANPKNISYVKSTVYSKGIKIKADYEEERKKWLIINDGIINNRKIKIFYIDSYGKESERVIAPYSLFTYYGANYFIGRCDLKNELRQFKLIRIKAIELLEEKFIKEDFNINNYLEDTIGIYRGNSYNIKLKIQYPYAQGFKEYSWVRNEEITDYLDEGYIVYEASIQGEVEAISWIMGMGANCEVLEPKVLKDKIIEEYRSTLEKYK